MNSKCDLEGIESSFIKKENGFLHVEFSSPAGRDCCQKIVLCRGN